MAEILQYALSGVTVGSIYAVVAIGFNLIYSTTGILNFAPIVLRLHERIYVENIDMTVSLEKVAFFARPTGRPKRK